MITIITASTNALILMNRQTREIIRLNILVDDLEDEIQIKEIELKILKKKLRQARELLRIREETQYIDTRIADLELPVQQ